MGKVFTIVVVILVWRTFKGLSKSYVTTRTQESVVVIVGGDFSSATRMQYHVLSLISHMDSNQIDNIHVVAYSCESGCMRKIQDMVTSGRILLHLYSNAFHLPFSCTLTGRVKNGKVLGRIFKAASPLLYSCATNFLSKLYRYFFRSQTIALWIFFLLLIKIARCESKIKFLLVQNPPSIPILPVSQLCACLLSCEIFVDWHNIGSTLFSYSRNQNAMSAAANRSYRDCFLRKCFFDSLNLTVFIHWWIELVFGPGHLNIGVSRRMCMYVGRISNMSFWERTKHALMFSYFGSDLSFNSCPNTIPKHVILYHDQPLFSKVQEFALPRADMAAHKRKFWGEALGHETHPKAYFIMSCSWSKDDDVKFFTDAIHWLVRSTCSNSSPDMHIVLTGKGPEHHSFINSIQGSSRPELQSTQPLRKGDKLDVLFASSLLTSVYFHKYEDYMEALRRCDVGLCVHRSSSGIDLPMKIAEYFTCGTPVIALEYDGISEMLGDGSTRLGWAVGTPEEMGNQMIHCASEALTMNADIENELQKAKNRIHQKFSNAENCWESRWKSLLSPVFWKPSEEGNPLSPLDSQQAH